MNAQLIFEIIATGFQIAGAGVMVVGVVVALFIAVLAWRQNDSASRGFAVLRATIGSAILLGLEILVAADLIRTVTSTPSLTDTIVLALIVLIRTGLSFSLQVEIEGVAPWRRALLPTPHAPGASSTLTTRSDAR